MKHFIFIILLLTFHSLESLSTSEKFISNKTGDITIHNKTIFITGGNRGIGYALVVAYLEKGYRVYTTYRCRKNSKGLLENKNPNLYKIKIDILDPNAIGKIEKEIGSLPIDILIHSAGFFGYRSNQLPNLDSKEWLDAFNINAIFPIQLSLALKENIMKSPLKKIIFISSRRSSNSMNLEQSYRGRYSYRSSKAALNSSAIALSQDFEDDLISILILHPGRVATKMTNYDGISPNLSALNIIRQIEKLELKNTGHFLSAETGKKIDW